MKKVFSAIIDTIGGLMAIILMTAAYAIGLIVIAPLAAIIGSIISGDPLLDVYFELMGTYFKTIVKSFND